MVAQQQTDRFDIAPLRPTLITKSHQVLVVIVIVLVGLAVSLEYTYWFL